MGWLIKEQIADLLDEERKNVDIDEEATYDEMSSCILTTLGMFEDLVEAREKNRIRVF